MATRWWSGFKTSSSLIPGSTPSSLEYDLLPMSTAASNEMTFSMNFNFIKPSEEETKFPCKGNLPGKIRLNGGGIYRKAVVVSWYGCSMQELCIQSTAWKAGLSVAGQYSIIVKLNFICV